MPEPMPVLRNRLDAIRDAALEHLADAVRIYTDALAHYKALAWHERDRTNRPTPQTALSPQWFERAGAMRRDLRSLMVAIADLLKRSPLISDADIRDVGRNARTMDSALSVKSYRQWGIYIHHDEGTLLGVDPPGQEETALEEVSEAQTLFKDAYESVSTLLDYYSPNETKKSKLAELAPKTSVRTYRPNTAFIIMKIDPADASLTDVMDTVKSVFKNFNIVATRADDIEHEGKITDRVLQEIATSEYLLADLTGERPSVYYEIGYAHAIGKHPIMYHKKGSPIHFDLKDYNCPEYDGISDLRRK